MKECSVFLAIMAASIMAMVAGDATAGPWQTVYQTDFSSDPGWTTNSPSNNYWDSVSGAYYHKEVNGTNGYTYKSLPGLSSGLAWRLEYDIKPVSLGWAAGSRLMFSDPDMQVGSPTYFGLDFGTTDQGKRSFLLWSPTGSSDEVQVWFGNPFSAGVWYHSVVEWNPGTGVLSASVTTRDTGALLGEVTVNVAGEFDNIDRLAASTINHTYASGATAVGYFDNVQVSQVVPEPSSLVLLGMGALCVGAASRFRRQTGKPD